MRKWEDIVKDKMEEPEGALPESVFAEFCARWEAAMAVPSKRRFPLVWAVVPAVAAGLAAVLLLHKPSVPEGDIQIIQQPSAPVAVVTDTTTVVIPERTKATPVKMKVGPAAGMIAGGGLLAAIIPPILGAGTKMDNAPMADSDKPGGTVVLTPDPPKDERTGNAVHYFPLKVGLSARFPISDRLSITTGLDYSWYKSSFTYSVSGEKIQNAHYIGIPVRLDWTFASGRWLDVYLGGGLEGNYCLGATLAGDRVAKDGFSASLLGAGGIQFKITEKLGVYIEPELSWTFTPKNQILESYRTKNPLMFSVSSGLRITIGK